MRRLGPPLFGARYCGNKDNKEGHDLNNELWSAKVLLEAPEAIERVHLEFLTAGADCITTSTYQASLPGFCKHGMSREEGTTLLLLAVALATEARDTFWRDETSRSGRIQPLVAASIGPYGAFLADGSEYTGDYGISDDELYAFHKERWQILAESDADLLACETVPSRQEVDVLLRLLRETPGRWVWMSFSCRDGAHLSDGSMIADVARMCHDEARVAAVGINCTPPEFISPLITEVRKATDKPVIVYPNSGERYHPGKKMWLAGPTALDWSLAPQEWVQLGAVCVGGCCSVGPTAIAAMRRQLFE